LGPSEIKIIAGKKIKTSEVKNMEIRGKNKDGFLAFLQT